MRKIAFAVLPSLLSSCTLLLPAIIHVDDPAKKEHYELIRRDTGYLITNRRAMSEKQLAVLSHHEEEESISAPEPVVEKVEKKSTGNRLRSTAHSESPPAPSLISDGPLAEISPRGDLVHYVTNRSETLAAINQWYTRDKSTLGKVARMNNISADAKLSPGDTIVIPSYLVKNKQRYDG